MALSIFSDHLPEIRKACVENTLAVVSAHQPAKEMMDDDEWNVENIHRHANHLAIQEKTKNYIQIIKRIDGRKTHFSKKSITDEDIAAAKDVPLTDLYEGKLFGSKRKYGLCPFHEERSPSFYIFPKNNFKCFGCQLYGSPIDFVMHRDGVDFIKAVKILRGII